MPSNCAVATCKSWSGGHFNKKPAGISFFRFPKDPTLQATWLHSCCRQDDVNVKSACICSKHFTEADYDPSYIMKLSLMPGAYTQPKLKPDAVPSRNLPSSLSGASDDSRAAHLQQREEKDVMKKLPGEATRVMETNDIDRRSEHSRATCLQQSDGKEAVEKLLGSADAVTRTDDVDSVTSTGDDAINASAGDVSRSGDRSGRGGTRRRATNRIHQTTCGRRKGRLRKRSNKKLVDGLRACVNIEDHDNPGVMPLRDCSTERHHEEQEKEERKALVERLLAEHEEREQAALLDAMLRAETQKTKRPAKKRRVGKSPTAQDSVARTVPSTAVTMWGASNDTTGVGSTADLADDGRLPSEYDDATITAGSDNDGDDVDQSLAGAGTVSLQTSPSVGAGKPVEVILLNTSASGHCSRPKPPKRQNLMVERAKEIMRLKLRVRRLEARCLRALGGPAAHHPGGEDGVDEWPIEKEPAGVGKGTVEQGSPAEAKPDATTQTSSEEPLVILRNDRSSKMPSLVRQLRGNQLSDSLATFIPSNLQEAREANHRLKVQFLKLQAIMLNWAIKSKRIRTTNLKRAEEGRGEDTVRGQRLRELLRLETAVKAIFTESQIRAIVVNHGDSSGGDLMEKHRKNPWGEEDLLRMLELRAISSDKVVEHVREKMKIPLPSLKTVRLRCRKSQKLSEAYNEMLQKHEELQKRCDMCNRQVSTIDEVIGGTEDESPGAREKSPFGRQFVQRVPKYGQDAADVTAKKRRRTAAAATLVAKKMRQKTPSMNWPNTSDSDAELSDPGVWGRIPPPRVSWHPGMIESDAPSDRPPSSPLRSELDSFGLEQTQRSWR